MKSQIQVTIATSLIEAGKDPLVLDKEGDNKEIFKSTLLCYSAFLLEFNFHYLCELIGLLGCSCTELI